MHDRPTASELLGAVQAFLEEEIVPATTGRRQFLARVAANCVGMVDREFAAEQEHVERAWTGLDALCGAVAEPQDRRRRAAAVTERLTELCERIRAGDFDEGSKGYESLLAFARGRVRDKLELSNPRLLEADRAREIR